MNAGTWEQVVRQDSCAERTPLTFQSQALPFVASPDSTALTPSPPPPALVVFDDTCSATQHNQPPKNDLKTGRRVLRRPNPVAVPNLTKKARGRPVPTKDTLLKPGSGRVYACPVEDCRKVFTRSEHLKRHTRSIHTNEKREFVSQHYARR